LEARLNDTVKTIGQFWQLKDPVCGGTLEIQSPQIAKSLDKLAKENPAVRRFLNKLMEGSAWGEVFLAFFPLLAAIAIHHEMIPDEYKPILGGFIATVAAAEAESEQNGNGEHP
jgi:hypothetical protein